MAVGGQGSSELNHEQKALIPQNDLVISKAGEANALQGVRDMAYTPEVAKTGAGQTDISAAAVHIGAFKKMTDATPQEDGTTRQVSPNHFALIKSHIKNGPWTSADYPHMAENLRTLAMGQTNPHARNGLMQIAEKLSPSNA